jgi:hypothetical protein
MRRLVLPFVVASLVARLSYADTATDADALITKGLELREKGKDEEALNLFRQAQLKSPSPRARAQVALAEQALGLWVLAETDLSAALAESDPWITKNRSPLEGALAVIRKHIASLEVRGAASAEVFIDGQKIGSGEGPFRVEAGRRTLEVKRTGYQATSRAVDLPAGGTARESVSLVVMPIVVAPSTSSTAPTPTPTQSVHADDGRGQRILGWVFVGVGGALLATGGISLLVRKNYVDDYNASTCPGLGAVQPASCQSQVDASHNWLTVAIVTLIGGGAALVGGGVIIGTAPRAASVACGPFGCSGTF